MSKKMTQEQAEKELEKGYNKANKILNNQDSLNKFFDDLSKKMKSVPLVGEVFSNIPMLASMIKAYASGEYKEAPVGTIVALISALLYFILPIDFVPDVIPIAGLLDDAAVLTTCLTLCQSDIDTFVSWKNKRLLDANTIDIDAIESDDE